MRNILLFYESNTDFGAGEECMGVGGLDDDDGDLTWGGEHTEKHTDDVL